MDYIFDGIIQAFRLLFGGDAVTYSAVYTTLRVSSMSIAASLALGMPLGFVLGYFDFPGKKLVRLVVDTLLAFPTVVIGLLAYAMFSYRGPLGGLGLLFTLPGIAIAQTVLGLPVVIALTATAVEGLDARLSQTALTLGADKRQLALTSLWEARYAVLTAGIAAYGRIVSEVGISMMVGGNIKWSTRTITTAIALETGKGQFAMGIALGLVLMFIVLLVNIFLAFLRKRSRAFR